MKKHFLIIILSLAAVFSNCSLNNDQIRNRLWKFGGGVPIIGDFPIFDAQTLRNDTIFDKIPGGAIVPVAIVYKTEDRTNADDLLYVKDLKTGEIGEYCDKGEIKK